MIPVFGCGLHVLMCQSFWLGSLLHRVNLCFEYPYGWDTFEDVILINGDTFLMGYIVFKISMKIKKVDCMSLWWVTLWVWSLFVVTFGVLIVSLFLACHFGVNDILLLILFDLGSHNLLEQESPFNLVIFVWRWHVGIICQVKSLFKSGLGSIYRSYSLGTAGVKCDYHFSWDYFYMYYIGRRSPLGDSFSGKVSLFNRISFFKFIF